MKRTPGNGDHDGVQEKLGWALSLGLGLAEVAAGVMDSLNFANRLRMGAHSGVAGMSLRSMRAEVN
jgi:hypothetical protein